MSIVINIKIKGLLNRNKRSNNSYQLLKLKKYLSTLILLFILSFNSLFASEP